MFSFPSIAYRGLAGTGKSKVLRAHIRANVESSDFILLTFNRALVANARASDAFFTPENTMTLHSLCYRILKSISSNFIPDKVRYFMHKFPESNDVLFVDHEFYSGDFYSDLLTFFGEIPDHVIKQALGDLKLIAIDEVADVASDSLYPVIKTLHRIYGNIFAIAGDHFQRINEFGKNRFTHFKKDRDTVAQIAEELKIPEVISLRENFRSSQSIVDFVNGFLRINFPSIAEDYLYEGGLSPCQL